MRQIHMLLPFLLSLFGVPAFCQEVILPADPRVVIDVKKDCGARGDGEADDSEAFQTALQNSSSQGLFIFVPSGTYKITRTLVFRNSPKGGEGAMVGPWIFGQKRDACILKLPDDSAGFGDAKTPKELIRALTRADGAKMNADFFERTMVNLTIDTGNNPGAIGVKFYSNNTGIMEHVVVRGNGVCGIDLGFNGQNGPLLLKDIDVQGFATGIKTNDILNSQTLSHITVVAREVGLFHRGQVLACEQLNITAPLPIDSGGNGVLMLIDSMLQPPGPSGAKGPAIKLEKDTTVYAARVKTSGFSPAIKTVNAKSGDCPGPEISEYGTSSTVLLGSNNPKALSIKPEQEPELSYPDKPEDWVCANDFGAKVRDDVDDAEPIQKAIDEAAAKGKTGVYLMAGKGGDPNWYILKKDVHVHGSVRMMMGFGLCRVFAGNNEDPNFPQNLHRFIVDDDPKAPKTVFFQCLQVFAPSPSFGIETTSGRTTVCRSTGASIIAKPNSIVFMDNCVGFCYQEPGSKIWIRQWNTEGGPKKLNINTRNDGGQLWVLGMKTEAKSIKLFTLNGGKSEVLGVHNYNTSGAGDGTAFFKVENASLSVACYREINWSGAWWKTTVLANIDGKESAQPASPWQTWSLLRVGK